MRTIATLMIPLLFFFTADAAVKYKPLTVPENVRVTSSEPRKTVWDGLTDKEMKLAGHLLAAAKAGETIIYFQTHRHSLLINEMIEKSLRAGNIQKTEKLLGPAGFGEFLNYAAKFKDQKGPYASSNRKYVLTKVTAVQVSELFRRHLPRANGSSVSEAVRLLTDSEFEVISQPEDSEGTELEISGGNNYEKGIKGAEVSQALKNGMRTGVNCRIVRGNSAVPECQVQALNNPKLDPVVRKALTAVVSELRKAVRYASTDNQGRQLHYLIRHLETGEIEDFRQMNIEWVKDGTNSKVDFMMGYVEVYLDYLNQIGAWQGYVQIIDPKMTALSVALAKNAQGFENEMPYGDFKKTFPADYSPPALMVYYFQELVSVRSGGYNLPNFDDIRRDVGAKNIIRLELPGQDFDPVTLKVRREMYDEFAPKAKVEGIMQDWTKARQAKVLLHEIIGHGSGTYDVTKYGPKEDPIGALGSLGAALEEQRADLAALVFCGDQRLVNVGFYKDLAEARRVRNVMYDTYIANFMRDVSKQQSLSEAHQRGHWLLINLLLEEGAVEKISRDGLQMTDQNFVLAVKDYDKFFQGSQNLLAELQRIKASRDEKALKALFTKHAPLDEISAPWMQAMIVRGKNLAINAGAIEQPWEVRGGKLRTFGTLSLKSIAPHLGK
jgi:dipeptidyl-peptidase III